MSHQLVRNHILTFGLDEAKESPFGDKPSGISSYTRQVTDISDDDLDRLIRHIRQERGSEAGISLLRGHLRSEGDFIPKFRKSMVFRPECIVASLTATNSFLRSSKCCLAEYSGIVIHRFIDGYSRLITGLRAADNNKGETVLGLFLEGASTYNVHMGQVSRNVVW